MVTHQREATAGELDPDLMAAAGVQPDGNEGSITLGETPKFQPCGFDTGSLLFYNKNLVFTTVFEEKILPIAGLRGCAVDKGHVFFDHSAVLDGFAQSGGSGFCAGVDHDAANIFVQPVQRKDLSTEVFF